MVARAALVVVAVLAAATACGRDAPPKLGGSPPPGGVEKPFERGARGFVEAVTAQQVAPVAEFVHNREPTRFLRCAGNDCTVERETRGFDEMIAHLHRYQADVAGAEPRCVHDCCELERAGARVATLCFAWDAKHVSYLAEVRVYQPAAARQATTQ